jgi:arylsulfatase A-like enzyme
MNRRTFLLTTAAGAAGRAVNGQQPGQPNFVIIYTDDQGIGDLGCYGARDVRTPNLDRLAETGARFTDWYTNSPVCSPSRASLLTGKYPQRAGIPEVLSSEASFSTRGLRQGETTLQGELKKLGYRTAVIGKWHLGSAAHSRPLAQGFDEFFGFYSGWIDGHSHRYYRQNTSESQIFHDLWHNEEEVWEDPEYHTDLFSTKAREFLLRQSGSAPFLLYLAYGAPHYPMIAPRKYTDRFPASMDRDRRMHAAMLSAIDDGVGEVMSALREKGLDRNTVVFFQSDNGATQEIRADHRARPYRGGSNAPFRGFKAGLFEGGIRMPALMRWPGRIPAGTVVREMGAAMDVFPTFLRWADPNRSEIADIDGRDVGAMVARGSRSPHDAVFWSYLKQRAVRRGDWKLIVNPPSVPGDEVKDVVWLSNLKDDFREKQNQAANNPSVTKDLQARLAAWEKAAFRG